MTVLVFPFLEKKAIYSVASTQKKICLIESKRKHQKPQKQEN